MKANRSAGTNLVFSVFLFSLFLFFPGLTAKGQSCFQSGTGAWQNHAFTSQSSQFVVTYSVTPSHASMNGVVGFSLNAANAMTSLAVIVQFSNTGVIDVRNGGSFMAATSYSYKAGTQYAFQLVINPATRRYSVFVTAPGGAQVQLASNYAFRSSQSSISSLNSWATYSKGGTEKVCNMTIAGSSVTAPTITTQPANETVTSGQTATFSVTASGTAPLTYQWAKNGAAISGATAASYTTPATTSADNGSQFVVTVSNSAGSVKSTAATLTVTSTPGTLSLSSSSLSFGSVNVSSSKTLSTTLTNTGVSSVTVSSVSISGAGFNDSGVSSGQIITAGQAVTVNVTFAPAASGSVSGSLTITSNASNSPTKISFSGTGAAVSYSTLLSWTASTSSVTGYNVYRGTTSGGPYTKVNPNVDANTSYSDASVQAGLTYYYVVTSVNSGGVESAYSTQVSATIP